MMRLKAAKMGRELAKIVNKVVHNLFEGVLRHFMARFWLSNFVTTVTRWSSSWCATNVNLLSVQWYE